MLDLSRAIQRLNAELPIGREANTATDVATVAQIDEVSSDVAELFNFYDDALQAGCRVIDFAPSDGAAAIQAATAPAGDVRVVAISNDEPNCTQIRERVAAQDLTQSISVRWDANHAMTLDALCATEFANALPLLVHAGEAASIPWIAKGALESIRKSRIGVIAWRCIDSSLPESAAVARDADVAATLLSVLGFEHFALAERDGALELVPLSIVASNNYVFSVSPDQRAKWSA